MAGTSKPERVDALIEALVQRFERPRGRGRGVYKLLRAFDKLGPPVSERAEAVGFRAGTLTLVVEDPTWLTELGFLKEEIIERLARAAPNAPPVREIRMRLGKFERKRKRELVVFEPVLSAEDENRVRAWGETIRDEELRKTFERAARLALASR